MPSNSEPAERTLFTKQRDILIHEIAELLQLVNEKLARINRQLNESVQVGKSFDDVGKTWATFYNRRDVTEESIPKQNSGENSQKSGLETQGEVPDVSANRLKS